MDGARGFRGLAHRLLVLGLFGNERPATLGGHLLDDTVYDLQKNVNDLRVEVRTSVLLDDRLRLLVAPGRSIGPRGRKRVVHIGDGQYPGQQRYLLTFQPRWVPGPIPLLMVVENDRLHRPRKLNRIQNGRADLRMEANLGELVVRQPSRL